MSSIFITWKFKSDNNIIIGTTDNFKYNSSIIIMELKNILIEKIYKKTNINEYNWNIIFPIETKNKIEEINKRKGSIIFFEILDKKNFILKQKFKLYVDVLSKLNIEAIVILSFLRNTYYDKPFTGLFNILNNVYTQNKKKINKKKSILVGTHGGRSRTRNYNKYDYNCNDRSFAHNIGMSFVTPEDFFINKFHNFYWEWNQNLPNKNEIRKYMRDANQYNIMNVVKELKKILIPHQKNIIICYGPPLYEKKIFCNLLSKYLIKNTKIQKWNKIKNINNKENIYQICIYCFHYLNLKKFDKMIKEKNIKIILLKFDIPINISILLNNIFLEIKKDKNIKKINNINYSIYLKNKNNDKNIIENKLYNIIYYKPTISNIKELFYKY